MTHSNIADADISCIAEKQEPKNAFTGRTKDAIQDYKSCVGEKAHFNHLRKWSMLSDDRSHEVCRFSHFILTTVKPFSVMDRLRIFCR